MQLPTILFVRGMPGSGKSYLAAALAKELGEDRVVTLDPDATDYKSQAYLDHVKAQIAEGVDPALHAYRFLRAQAYQAIAARKIIIWNQAFTNLEIFHKMVARLQEQAALHHLTLPVLVVEVEIDPELAKKRILARQRAGGHGASDVTLAQNLANYQFESFAGAGYPTVAVQGDADVRASAATVLQSLRGVWQ